MKRKVQIGNTMFAAITFGIVLLLIAGVSGAQCGRGERTPVVIMDTAYVKSDTAAHHKRKPKTRKKKPAGQTAQPAPDSRDYRDEIVN